MHAFSFRCVAGHEPPSSRRRHCWRAAHAGRYQAGTAQGGTPATTSTLGWADELVDDNGKLNVVTTVAPISSIVRNVGGDRIDLHGVIPDGTNSHTFEPAPSDAKFLSQADIIVVNGSGS